MKTIRTCLATTRQKLAAPAVLVLVISLVLPYGQPRRVLAAVQPVKVSSLTTLGVVQQWSLTAPEPAIMEEFGYAVSIDGSTVVVGARNADPNLGGGPIVDAGAAYVYTHSSKTWVLQGMLTAKDASPGDTFGVSVAISGNTILVGATGVDLEEGGDLLKDAGAAYVFTRSNASWIQQTKLTASDPAEDDSFGSAVAISGKTAVIAAETKDYSDIVDVGAAYIFYNNGGKSWKEQAELLPAAPFPGYYFGASVAIDQGLIAVGASQFYPIGESGTGLVYLYRRQGGLWSQATVLEAQDGRPGDGFGDAVSISGNIVVVGADHADPYIAGRREISAGAAYVFTNNKGPWEESAVLTPADGLPFGQFGQAVDIDGSRLVVGASGATQAGEDSAGAVYVYEKSKGEWNFQTRAVTDPVGEDDLFGKSVAIDQDWFVAGASGRNPQDMIRAGEAFVNLLGAVQLPATGFAPGLKSVLPAQPAEQAYQNYSEMRLEIPAIEEDMAIVGVPKSGNGWDVRWLGENVGYLEGTAFPTWTGNTGLAGHATLADGSPGPFAALQALKWGDQVIIHSWGQRYIYEVRANSLVAPGQSQVLGHEERPWVTLITCQGYDEQGGSYRWRRVVRAVLVAVLN
jgi:LPXTG-site transpeptidase (sortase) family protein